MKNKPHNGTMHCWSSPHVYRRRMHSRRVQKSEWKFWILLIVMVIAVIAMAIGWCHLADVNMQQRLEEISKRPIFDYSGLITRAHVSEEVAYGTPQTNH